MKPENEFIFLSIVRKQKLHEMDMYLKKQKEKLNAETY